jgi:hypothetical protein
MTKRRTKSRSRRPTRVDYTPSSVQKEISFADEYSYVLSDLKRFATLAAGMFITLGVLGLILG